MNKGDRMFQRLVRLWVKKNDRKTNRRINKHGKDLWRWLRLEHHRLSGTVKITDDSQI